MSHDLSLKETQKEYHGTLKSYLIGFIVSLVLTIVSFSLVASGILSGLNLVYTIVSLALTQAIVQLLFFLHLGQEEKPRWETFIFYFMVLILLIVVIGSLWIMSDLNERMMSNMGAAMSHD
ncbi:MAG: cytochrome o ubiquinol oxidase subunit IV [Parachlamydiaceae bacterium]|nr:cytochrome o ubiquinol oxidase subunit IV [Parachlamydiaceae bacterium]